MAAESKLQAKIIKDAEKSGWFVLKLILTNKPGITDLLLGKNGKTLWIECKSEGKRPTPLQLHRHSELQKQGFQVFVIDTWECYLQIKYQHL